MPILDEIELRPTGLFRSFSEPADIINTDINIDRCELYQQSEYRMSLRFHVAFYSDEKELPKLRNEMLDLFNKHIYQEFHIALPKLKYLAKQKHDEKSVAIIDKLLRVINYIDYSHVPVLPEGDLKGKICKFCFSSNIKTSYNEKTVDISAKDGLGPTAGTHTIKTPIKECMNCGYTATAGEFDKIKRS